MKTVSFLYENERSLSEVIDKEELNINTKYVVRIYTAIAAEEEALGIVGKILSIFPDASVIGCSASGIIYDDVQYEDKTLVMFESYDKTTSAVKAFRFHTYHIVRVFGNHGDHVQIHRAGHYHAVVVVGVVASDLGAAGRGIDGGLPFPAV